MVAVNLSEAQCNRIFREITQEADNKTLLRMAKSLVAILAHTEEGDALLKYAQRGLADSADKKPRRHVGLPVEMEADDEAL